MPPELEPELLGLVVVVLPLLEPALPVVSVDPLGLVVVEPPVLMLLPASEPLARGRVAPARPCGEVLSVRPGDWPLLVRLPVSLPLFLQAPTPAISAAADAKAISLPVM